MPEGGLWRHSETDEQTRACHLLMERPGTGGPLPLGLCLQVQGGQTVISCVGFYGPVLDASCQVPAYTVSAQ